jgi:hypothetical protein
MLHIATMIENAGHAVTDIEVKHKRCIMALLQTDKLTQEQKMLVMDLFKPTEEAIKVAQSKFSYDV